MLYWSLMFLLLALAVSLLDIAFTPAGARKILPGPYSHTRWDWATSIPHWVQAFASEISGGGSETP